jgi:GNAT superfamily N-acetyltransferase
MQAMLRKATVADAEAIHRVNIETWQSSYRDVFPEEFLAKLPSVKKRESIRNFLKNLPPQTAAYVVEVPLVGIVGFTFGGQGREKFKDFDGELYGLYVLKEYQRHGLGGLLLRSIATFLEVNKFKKMFAWTLATSPYTAFYRKIGAVECGKEIREFGSITRELIVFGWLNISDLLARLEVLVK